MNFISPKILLQALSTLKPIITTNSNRAQAAFWFSALHIYSKIEQKSCFYYNTIQKLIILMEGHLRALPVTLSSALVLT